MTDNKNGLFTLMTKSWNGPMGFWVKYAYVMTIVIFGVGVWVGIEFYHAQTVDDRVFWGVWLLVDIIAVGLLKIWLWMDMLGFVERE